MGDDSLTLFRQTGALLEGHFVLRSGLHNRQYFRSALLLQHAQLAAQVRARLADKLRGTQCDGVISPALGGLSSVRKSAESLGKRHLFVEKEAGGLLLRHGFKISPNERLIVAEDVVPRDGRVQE